MSSKKIRGIMIALMSSAVVTASVFAMKGGALDSTFTPWKPKKVNAISGIEGSNGPVLVVKIDDTTFAHPQVGIESADLVYIEQVEGGLTRLAAVFSRMIPDRIGPVRSARITDVDLLSQYGYIAFGYSGAQRKLRPVLAAANWKDVGAERLGRTYYANAPDRIAPYAMMMNAPAIMQLLQEKAEPIAQSRSMGWGFGKAPESGTAISTADIFWPAARYSAQWSENEKRWLLFHNGKPNLSDTGFHLGASTFVIQLVKITPSEYRDKVGGITPLSEVIGSGNGFILRDGRVFPARWKRESAASGTKWSDQTGQDIAFAPGQIWVALTDQAPRFTPATNSQPPSPRT